MPKKDILTFIKDLGRPVFTSHELAAASGKSLSTVIQAFGYLERQGLIRKAYRGIWVEAGNKHLSPYSLIPFLFPRGRAYLSFLSALHLYGIIEQIPQVITLASTSHTRIIKSKLGIFSAHQIAPSFFRGFDWYHQDGDFLIAEPEKALVDSFYLSACKGRQFAYFPELRLPSSFSLKRAKAWAESIRAPKIKAAVLRKLEALRR